MNSDIKLEDGSVVLEGDWIKLHTHDLILDAPSRRRKNGGARRALVHDFKDGLTVNYNSDYPGGVTILGETKIDSLITDSLKTNQLASGSLNIGQFRLAYSTISHLVLGDSSATKMSEMEGPGFLVKGSLHVYGNATFDDMIQTPDVMIHPKNPGGNAGDQPQYKEYSLVERLQELQNENNILKEQMAELAFRLEKLERR